jgi:7-cyano-7-deazaguanine synthase in queuosine biosynthesis
MCQIIAIDTTVKKFKELSKDQYFKISMQNMLEEKGGDYYSCALLTDNRNTVFRTEDKETPVEELIKDIRKYIKTNNLFKKNPLRLLFFSRQQPEMEEDIVEEQPYSFKKDYKHKGYFAVHGTIHNDKNLASNLNAEIKADTEILKFINPEDWHKKAEGSYAAIGITDKGVVTLPHGLEIWKNKIVNGNKFMGYIFGTTSKVVHYNPNKEYQFIPWEYPTKDILFASFSGGMDISLSVFKALASGDYKKLVLNYFAWGSKAEEMEMIQLEKFKKFYKTNFPNVEIEVRIWEAEKYFSEYFEMNGASLPKISVFNYESKAETEETESPLSYVPYRNTQFAILLASRAEALGLKNVDLLFGLNLSEGMVFMDNSEGWIEAINKVIKFGGKDFAYTSTYDVIAPYFPRTKTNMLKEFKEYFGIAILEQLLDLSKSCYYPDLNGNPCGECGSCILRKKALQKIKEI